MEEKILEIVKEDVEKEGFDIVEIKCSGFKGQTNIKVFIDKTYDSTKLKQDIISVSDCEKVSGIIGFLLDGSDLNISNYDLEVSSPGLDRPLTTETDFKRHIDETVMIFLKEEVNNRNYFEGEICDAKDGSVTIKIEDDNIKIPLDKISKAKLKIEI